MDYICYKSGLQGYKAQKDKDDGRRWNKEGIIVSELDFLGFSFLCYISLTFVMSMAHKHI